MSDFSVVEVDTDGSWRVCELALKLGLARNGNTFYFELVALNIADFVEHAIDLVPDRVALVSDNREMTYAQLEDLSLIHI